MSGKEPGWRFWERDNCTCASCRTVHDLLDHRDAGGCTNALCSHCRAWAVWQQHPEMEDPTGWRSHEDPFKALVVRAIQQHLLNTPIDGP